MSGVVSVHCKFLKHKVAASRKRKDKLAGRASGRPPVTELSETAVNAIDTESESVPAEDFHRLRALFGLCPLGRKDAFPLEAVLIYFLLTVTYTISSRINRGIAYRIGRESRRCSHFVAVSLDKRIATARRLWAEQMINHER